MKNCWMKNKKDCFHGKYVYYYTKYDSEKNRMESYYMRNVTVAYQDPDTGETKTTVIRESKEKKNWFEEIGTEVRISIVKSKNNEMILFAQPKVFYYIISLCGVGALIASTFFFIRYIRDEFF